MGKTTCYNKITKYSWNYSRNRKVYMSQEWGSHERSLQILKKLLASTPWEKGWSLWIKWVKGATVDQEYWAMER
jgi:hypothetical protein